MVCYVTLYVPVRTTHCTSAGIAIVTTRICIKHICQRKSTSNSIHLMGPMMGQQVQIDTLQDLQLFINLLLKFLTSASNESFPGLYCCCSSFASSSAIVSLLVKKMTKKKINIIVTKPSKNSIV